MKLKIITIVATVILLSACKKSEPETKIDNSIDPKLLCGKTYYIKTANFTIKGDDKILFDVLQECDKDNTYTFNCDGTFIKQIGTIKYNNWDKDIYSTWRLDKQDSRKIELLYFDLLHCDCDSLSSTSKYWQRIAYLDSTKLVIQKLDPGGQYYSGGTYEYTFIVK